MSTTGLHPPPPAPPAAAARPPPPAPPAAPPAPTAHSAAGGDDDAPPKKMSPFEAALAKKVRASQSQALLDPHQARASIHLAIFILGVDNTGWKDIETCTLVYMTAESIHVGLM